jgi:predicted solute-binding protein
MRLIVHDTLATAPLLFPVQEGWVEGVEEIVPMPEVWGSEVGPEDAALIPSAEVAHVQDSHAIVSDVAVVAQAQGAIAMRCPVRPDEIAETPVRLYHVSGTAEVLARATLRPFFGIIPTEWSREEQADAQVVIVEGIEAVREPEAGYAEDLCRAWYILTGQPVVTHVLIVPREARQHDVERVVALLDEARRLAHERRRDLRRTIAEQHGVSRDRLATLFTAQRYRLEEHDRQALLLLLQRGTRGSAYPPIRNLLSWEPALLA